MVKHLRRRNPRHKKEFCIDGGWGSEEESAAFCIGCGAPLAYSLTDYGVEQELEAFLDYDFSREDITPRTAYELLQVFAANIKKHQPQTQELANRVLKLIA
jgi:hypothetical protein